MLQVGSVVGGKFRIERELGRGGMGTVYAATNLHLNSQVALKFLNPSFIANPQTVERFLREARSAAQLHSEHVCRVHDVEHDGVVPFIVMELLSGTDLHKLLRSRGPLAPHVAADYIAQTCAGLAEAHAANIVHRDLKPGNLFLARRSDGSSLVKVLDFGVAKSTQGTSFSLTQTANVVGSPGYMSPEQLRSSKVVDLRTDIWALGVILFELVTGEPPFRAESITELAIKITLDPTPALPNVPPAYAAVVRRCLEKDADRRYSDVLAVAAALVDVAPRAMTNDAVGRLLERSSPAARRPAVEATGVYVRESGPESSTLRDEPPVVVAAPVTTLAHASGMMVAPRPSAPRGPRIARRTVGVFAAAAVVGALLGVAFVTRGDRDVPEEPVAEPAAAQAVVPVVAPPSPPPPATDQPAQPPPPLPPPPPHAQPPVAEPPPARPPAPSLRPAPAPVASPPRAVPPAPSKPVAHKSKPPRDVGDSQF